MLEAHKARKKYYSLHQKSWKSNKEITLMPKAVDICSATLWFYKALALALCGYPLMGCSVFSAAGTAVSTAASVAGTVVSTTASVASTVVGGAVSVVKP